MSSILNLLLRGKNDDEIMAELGIAYSTYFRYKDALKDELISKFKQLRKSDVAQWSELLHMRLTRYLGILDDRLAKATDAKDVALLAQLMVQISEKLFEFETQTLQRLEGIRSTIELEDSIKEIQDSRNNIEVTKGIAN